MNKVSLPKLFLIFFIFTILPLQTFAAEITNMLSEVIVTKSDDYTYGLNLVFNDDFKGKAFLRTSQDGEYSVFIPDTAKASKTVKIKNQAKDMPKIKVVVGEKPYIKDNVETSYIKLDITADSNYSINLISRKADENPPLAPIMKYLFIVFGVIIAVFCVIFRIVFNNGKQAKTYTVFPEQFTYDYNKRKENSVSSKEIISEASTPPLNNTATLKTADKNTFHCFDINQYTNNRKQADFKVQSSIKQTSLLTKDLKESSVLTNPLNQTIMEDSSEFNMPFAEEIAGKDNLTEQESSQDFSVISVLELTPTKGFYLKEINDEFCLFGFTGERTFLLKKFRDLSQINLQARFYDQNSRSDIYIVKLDSYKSMIEISEDDMRELAVL